MTDQITVPGETRTQFVALDKQPDLADPWRVFLSERYPYGEMISELTAARSRKVTFDLYKPATFDFAIDGRLPQTAEILELVDDLQVYRWDGQQYVLMFRGMAGQSQDTVSETTHTVTVNCVDYASYLDRRFLGDRHKYGYSPLMDQAKIVIELMTWAQIPPSWLQDPYGNMDMGMDWGGAWHPDNQTRYPSDITGINRQRTYEWGGQIGKLIDDLSRCIDGFDYAALPRHTGGYSSELRIWYPQRGGVKDFIAMYGSNVASLSRTVQTSEYANLTISVGAEDPAGVADPNTNQKPSIAWGVADNRFGLDLMPERAWATAVSFSDVSVLGTLQENAHGDFNYRNKVVPVYTLHMTPGTYNPSDFWLGDTIRLVVESGRLHVDTQVRVSNIAFTVNDQGTEQVAVTVGRPLQSYLDVLNDTNRRLQRLERR